MDPLVRMLGVIIPLIIASGGWFFAWFLHRRNFKEQEKLNRIQPIVNQILAYLDKYAELNAIYRLFYRSYSEIERDEKGNFLKNENGEYFVKSEVNVPEAEYNEASEKTYRADLWGAVAVFKLEIRRLHALISDKLSDLGFNEEILRHLAKLNDESTSGIEFWIKHKNFDRLKSALESADKLRKDIRQEIIAEANSKFGISIYTSL